MACGFKSRRSHQRSILMAKNKTNIVIEPTKKKTSIGGNHAMLSTKTMNKNKRASYKKYRGQGR
jgi:hypothetical protein